MLLSLGKGGAQTTREDLRAADPRVFDTVNPASYRLDFPILPPSDPMGALSKGEMFSMPSLDDPQRLFEAVNATALPAPPVTPGDYDPQEIFQMGSFLDEEQGQAVIDYPTPTPREIILLDRGHPVFYEMGKTAELFQMEESPLNLALPVIPEPSTVLDRDKKNLIRLGAVRGQIDLAGSVATVSNVFGAQSDGGSRDVLYNFNPRLYLETGTRGFASLRYSPTFSRYQRYPGLDAANQSLSFSLRYPWTKLKAGADFSYLTQSGLFLTSNGRADQSAYLSSAFLSYPFTQKTEAELSYLNAIQNNSPGGRKIDHQATLSVDHELGGHLTLGGYATGGYAETSWSRQSHQTLGVQGVYRPDYHFRFSGKAGLHTRRLSPPAGKLGTYTTPVFDLVASYHRTVNAGIVARAYRLVTSDAFGSVTLQAQTGVEGSILLRLHRKTDVKLKAGTGVIEQWSNTDPLESDFRFVEGGVTISYAVTRHSEVSLFDNYQRRFADSQGNNYASNTIGLAFELRF